MHVLDAGLLEAEDGEIWSFALENGWVIITKDDDFSFRASVSKLSPKIVWVRVGNCSKQKLLEIFQMNCAFFLPCFAKRFVTVKVMML